MTNLIKLIFLTAILIMVAVGIFLWQNRSRTSVTEKKPGQEIVEFKKTDLDNANEYEKLPSGFPANLPLETENVIDSYSQSYPEKKVIIVGYTYSTSKVLVEVLQSYKTYFSTEGYTLGQEKIVGGATFLTGRKNSDELLVIVSLKGELAQVQLTYTDIE